MPAESDVLRDEVDRRISDVLAGKRKVTSYSSGEEYIRYVRKMLSDDDEED